MDGGGELEGGGHADVGVAALLDCEHAGTGCGGGEPEGEGGERDVVRFGDRGERRGRLGEVGENLLCEGVGGGEDGRRAVHDTENVRLFRAYVKCLFGMLMVVGQLVARAPLVGDWQPSRRDELGLCCIPRSQAGE